MIYEYALEPSLVVDWAIAGIGRCVGQFGAQVEEYFISRLSEDAGKEELRDAAAATVDKFPVLIDHFIRMKEDCGEEAHRLSGLKVQETQEQFVEQLRALVNLHLQGTEFYTLGDSYTESLRRVLFLKDVIENKGNADQSRPSGIFRP